MTPVLIPFEQWHLGQFINRDTGTYDYQPIRMTEGPCFSALLDGRILGSAGICVTFIAKVGVAWASFSAELLEKYPIWTTRAVRGIVDNSFRTLGLNHIEAVVNSNSEINMRWLEAAGFKPRMTYVRYVREA